MSCVDGACSTVCMWHLGLEQRWFWCVLSYGRWRRVVW